MFVLPYFTDAQSGSTVSRKLGVYRSIDAMSVVRVAFLVAILASLTASFAAGEPLVLGADNFKSTVNRICRISIPEWR